MKHNKFKKIPPRVTPKKKKEWTKAHTVIFILIIIWTLGSILGSIAFFRTNKDNSLNSNITAYADSLTGSTVSYKYTSDNIFIPANRIVRTSASSPSAVDLTTTAIPMTFAVTVEWDEGSDIYYLSFSVASGTPYFLQSISNPSGTWVNHGYTIAFNPTLHNDKMYFFASSESSDWVYGSMRVNVASGFDLSTVKTIGYSSNYSNAQSQIVVNDLYAVYNIFSLIDENNNRLSFGLISYTPTKNGIGWVQRYSWTARTYFINTDFNDNEYYLKGLYDGEMQNRDKYIQQGYQDGYANGKIEGETIGYNKGLENSDGVSFLGLFAALIDAPLQAITGLFNFDLLGFNMLGFVSAIFTAMVILIIIKMIFGGGGGKGG